MIAAVIACRSKSLPPSRANISEDDSASYTPGLIAFASRAAALQNQADFLILRWRTHVVLPSAVEIRPPAFRVNQLTKAIVIAGMPFSSGAACPMPRSDDITLRRVDVVIYGGPLFAKPSSGSNSLIAGLTETCSTASKR